MLLSFDLICIDFTIKFAFLTAIFGMFAFLPLMNRQLASIMYKIYVKNGKGGLCTTI